MNTQMIRDISETSVQYLKGVGPARGKLFSQLGVSTIEDLFYFFPRRYDDRRQMTPIAEIKAGQWHTISGKIVAFDSHQAWFTKKHVCKITVSDGKSSVDGMWFNQPFMSQYFKLNQKVIMYGKAEIYKQALQMVSPEYEIIDDEEDESLSIGRIVPVYPLTRGMTQRYLRKAVKLGLERYAGKVKDILPYPLRQKYKLLNLVKSLINIHFPENFEIQREAYWRISFEEFFLFQVSVLLRKASLEKKQSTPHQISNELIEGFVKSFPFELTQAQQRVVKEIAGDMKKDSPMHRLLQGDVGCGKTVVAFFGCAAAYENGYQSAMMAPTEILARQHYETVCRIIKNNSFKKMRTALLIGSIPQKEKDKIYADLKSGKIDLIIGTHALIEENLVFKNLSFVVIDEQHKFGVRQRMLLPAKGANPHTLIMTATPIPRTLCLSLYGDLEISVIDEMPQGRGTVQTLHFAEDSAKDVYTMVRDRLKKGEQAYIVYPVIEESSSTDLKAAKEMYQYFSKNEFKDFKVGLVHGAMKRKETEKVMGDFKNKRVDVLVATTVLEVGVDVPSATMMVIEHADRFGLSQLHQLRGRIGRGKKDGLCILVANPLTEEGKARIDAILETTDGFKIAEKDLLIRGPGEFFGRHQHGLNELKIANPVTQLDILQLARKEAMELLKGDSHLTGEMNSSIRGAIEKRYPAYLSLGSAG